MTREEEIILQAVALVWEKKIPGAAPCKDWGLDPEGRDVQKKGLLEAMSSRKRECAIRRCLRRKWCAQYAQKKKRIPKPSRGACV